MSSKKMKKEYFVLITIIIALLLLLVLKKGDKINYIVPKLAKLEKAKLTKIELNKTDSQIIIKKKNNNWVIEPNNFPTDTTKIDKILNSIINLNLGILVSRSMNYTLYDLGEDKKIVVRAYVNEKREREFELGKTASTTRHSYVKMGDDKNIYQVIGDLRDSIDKNIDDLRDKHVLKFNNNEFKEIVIKKVPITLNLTKKTIEPAKKKAVKGTEKPVAEEKEEKWLSAKGETADLDKVNSLLNSINDLSCEKYPQDVKKDDLQNPALIITLKGNRDLSLAIYIKAEGDQKEYYGTSSQNDYLFMISSYTAENILKKSDELITKKE